MMPEAFKYNRIYLLIFLLALIVRLISLAYCTAEWEPDHIGIRGVDSENYLKAGADIANDFNFKSKGVIIFGPGYPAFIGILQSAFGESRIVFLIIQCFLGGLTSVLLAYLAVMISGRIFCGALSGFLNAILPFGFPISHYFLSANLFVPLVLGAFIFLICGIKDKRLLYYIISGLLLAFAALTRPVGQYLILISILFFVLYQGANLKSLKKYLGLLLAVGIYFVVIFAWISHNNHYHRFNHISFAGPMAMFKGSALIKANVSGNTYKQELDTLTVDLMKERKFQEYYWGGYAEYAGKTFRHIIAEHPGATFKTILDNIKYYLSLNYDWVAFLMAILSAIYLVILRHYRLVVSLLSIYLYFLFFSGFSLIAQGPRILYPAQIGWVILVSFAISELTRKVREKFSHK